MIGGGTFGGGDGGDLDGDPRGDPRGGGGSVNFLKSQIFQIKNFFEEKFHPKMAAQRKILPKNSLAEKNFNKKF